MKINMCDQKEASHSLDPKRQYIRDANGGITASLNGEFPENNIKKFIAAEDKNRNIISKQLSGINVLGEPIVISQCRVKEECKENVRKSTTAKQENCNFLDQKESIENGKNISVTITPSKSVDNQSESSNICLDTTDSIFQETEQKSTITNIQSSTDEELKIFTQLGMLDSSDTDPSSFLTDGKNLQTAVPSKNKIMYMELNTTTSRARKFPVYQSPNSSPISPQITCFPSPCIFDEPPYSTPKSCDTNNWNAGRPFSRSPSPGSPKARPTRKNSTKSSTPCFLSRRNSGSLLMGYEQYQSLLDVPYNYEYAEASSDDLSSEWESDVPEVHVHRGSKPSGWRKLRNIVQWTPFFQTYKKQRYPWVQLAGHQGNFKAGPDQGTILKKLSVKEEKCFKVLMNDVLKPYVPEYKGQVTSDDGECSYIQLQDLLGDFVSPCVMDCKIGVRTYLEEELAKAKEKPKLRKDMYEKMIQIDPNAPTEEEHRLKAVTKPRYMVWRETISSTATLGFRIEGIRKADGTSSKDFKTTKTKDEIIKAFQEFTQGFPHAVPKYIQRLKAIKATLESSKFFNTHEVIGSSLLFVHDRYNASVWLIDFAKTLLLPPDINTDHSSYWKVGNHEDGYMIGINNIISIFVTMLEQQPVCVTPPPPVNIPDHMESSADRPKEEVTTNKEET